MKLHFFLHAAYTKIFNLISDGIFPKNELTCMHDYLDTKGKNPSRVLLPQTQNEVKMAQYESCI